MLRSPAEREGAESSLSPVGKYSVRTSLSSRFATLALGLAALAGCREANGEVAQKFAHMACMRKPAAQARIGAHQDKDLEPFRGGSPCYRV